MKKLTLTAILLFTLLAFFAAFAAADEKATEKKEGHAFVGAKKCKACHKALYTAWTETAHAKTYDRLSDEEKKKPECVTCHTTGMDAKDVLLEGVQCEACHGPGSDYKKAKIMNKKKWAADPEAHKKMAIDAGLLYPTDDDCKKCHTKEGNANFKEFKFEERVGEVHAVKKAEKKAKE